MPKKVKKVFGENPEVVTVLSTEIAFDENGDAVVEDEIAEVLEQIPGYEVEGEQEDIAPEDLAGEDEEPASEEDEEEEEEAKPKRPTRKAPKRG
jgi:hypothetical protein